MTLVWTEAPRAHLRAACAALGFRQACLYCCSASRGEGARAGFSPRSPVSPQTTEAAELILNTTIHPDVPSPLSLPCSHASSNFCLLHLPTLPQAAYEPGMLCFSLLAPPFHSRLRSGKHAHTLPFLHTFMCLIRWSPPDPETSQEQKPMSSIWVTRDSRFSVYPSK